MKIFKVLYVILFMVASIYVIVNLYSMEAIAQSAKASSLEPGCVTIGTIGTVIVSRCYDEETGIILYGDSAGWMSDPIQ